jgi:hypothetical protein
MVSSVERDPMSSARRVLMVVLVGALVLAACGGDDPTTGDAGGGPSASTTVGETAEPFPVLQPATGDTGQRALVAGVVTVPGGFLAIGERLPDDAGATSGDIQTVTTFWRSPDGRSWTMSDADPAVWGDRTADRVAQGPAGIVVLAGGADGRALVSSVDGEAWTVTPVTADLLGLPPDTYPGAFPVNDVAAFDRGFLALGQDIGGGVGAGDVKPLLLHSADGVSWSRATGPALASAPVLPEYVAGTAVLDDQVYAFVTVSAGDDVEVWRSPDSAATWERVGGTELFPDAEHVIVGAATAFDGRLVAAGHDHVDGAAKVWTSADGEHWESGSGEGLEGQGRFAPELFAARPGELLLVGTREPASDGAMTGTVWASADGLDWRRRPDDSAVTGRVDVAGVAVAGPEVAVVGAEYPAGVDLATIEFGAWWVDDEDGS